MLELWGLILVVVLYFTFFFILAQSRGNYGLVDVGWGTGFIVVAVYSLAAGGEIGPRKLLVTTLVILWGSRLSYHLFQRNWGQEEDFRYQEMKAGWDNAALNAFFRIFMLQAVILLIISSPVSFINLAPSLEISWWGYLGLVVWGIGYFFEVVGDKQLRDFLAQRKDEDEIMTEGLWRYTRHPNYFGESVIWWGVFLIALPLKLGWMTIIGPVGITYLLLYVSGVPLLEEAYADNERYQEYKDRTNKFFPWFPDEN